MKRGAIYGPTIVRADEDHFTLFGPGSVGLHLEMAAHRDPPGELPPIRLSTLRPAELVRGSLETFDLKQRKALPSATRASVHPASHRVGARSQSLAITGHRHHRIRQGQPDEALDLGREIIGIPVHVSELAQERRSELVAAHGPVPSGPLDRPERDPPDGTELDKDAQPIRVGRRPSLAGLWFVVSWNPRHKDCLDVQHRTKADRLIGDIDIGGDTLFEQLIGRAHDLGRGGSILEEGGQVGSDRASVRASTFQLVRPTKEWPQCRGHFVSFVAGNSKFGSCK